MNGKKNNKSSRTCFCICLSSACQSRLPISSKTHFHKLLFTNPIGSITSLQLKLNHMYRKSSTLQLNSSEFLTATISICIKKLTTECSTRSSQKPQICHWSHTFTCSADALPTPTDPHVEGFNFTFTALLATDLGPTVLMNLANINAIMPEEQLQI